MAYVGSYNLLTYYYAGDGGDTKCSDKIQIMVSYYVYFNGQWFQM